MLPPTPSLPVVPACRRHPPCRRQWCGPVPFSPPAASYIRPWITTTCWIRPRRRARGRCRCRRRLIAERTASTSPGGWVRWRNSSARRRGKSGCGCSSAGGWRTAATTRTDAATLRSLAEDAVAAARLLPEDAWAGLAASGRACASRFPSSTSSIRTSLRSQTSRPRPPPRRMPHAPCLASPTPRAPRPPGAAAGPRSRRATAFVAAWSAPATASARRCWPAPGPAMQRDYVYRQATHRADLPAPESDRPRGRGACGRADRAAQGGDAAGAGRLRAARRGRSRCAISQRDRR